MSRMRIGWDIETAAASEDVLLRTRLSAVQEKWEEGELISGDGERFYDTYLMVDGRLPHWSFEELIN